MNAQVAEYTNFLEYIEEVTEVDLVKEVLNTPKEQVVRAYLSSQQKKEFDDALDEHTQTMAVLKRVDEFMEIQGAMAKNVDWLTHFINDNLGIYKQAWDILNENNSVAKDLQWYFQQLPNKKGGGLLKRRTLAEQFQNMWGMLNALNKGGHNGGECLLSELLALKNGGAIQTELPLREPVKKPTMALPKFIKSVELQLLDKKNSKEDKIAISKVVFALRELNIERNIMNVEDVTRRHFASIKKVGNKSWDWFADHRTKILNE